MTLFIFFPKPTHHVDNSEVIECLSFPVHFICVHGNADLRQRDKETTAWPTIIDIVNVVPGWMEVFQLLAVKVTPLEPIK
jgi:hypothetical protein